MTAPAVLRRVPNAGLSLPLLMAVLLLPAVGLTLAAIIRHVPVGEVFRAVFAPDPGVFSEVFVHYALLPRAAVALLAGAALGMAGTLFQQVLRNPLAEPATLGALPGAQLGVMLVVLLAPGVAGLLRDAAALLGAAVAVAAVFAIAWRHRLAPVTLVMGGLIVSLAAGSAGVLLSLLHNEYLRGVFIWATGSLVQNDWTQAGTLAWRVALLMVLIVPLARPLTVAALADDSAVSLGLSLRRLRLLTLGAATALSAVVASAVGVIGFIGLAAPHLATLAGARTFAARLVWAPAVGAALLLLADGLVLAAGRVIAEVPTGTVTALLGAPLLIVLIRRMPVAEPTAGDGTPGGRRRRPGRTLAGIATVVAVVAVLALSERIAVGGLDLAEAVAGRWPRLMAAAAAGGMLALAGTILQRLTGNAMASPEVLGVSAGAAIAAVAALFLLPAAGAMVHLAAGVAGAAAVFPVLLLLARRVNYAPTHVLLTGVALGTLFSGIVSVIVASGDPRSMHVLVWMTGPTFRATSLHAVAGGMVLLLGLGAAALSLRWLAVLPLGAATSKSLGLRVPLCRLVLLTVAALLTAGATLIVGPLSFVGLMAPHMARLAGFARPASQVAAAVMIGAAIMIAADWAGRSLHFPYEIPAGILATLVGGPYFLWLLARRS